MGAPASIGAAQIQELSVQAAKDPALRLPASLANKNASQAEKEDYLGKLLQHDPGVFLERHREHLSADQRGYFEHLREDYEVDFYLKLLEDEGAADKGQQRRAVSSLAKNRRLAKMNRLVKEGYFEEEAARKRAPLLHHQYIGQYTEPRQPGAGANTLHDRIIQQHEEMQLLSSMAQEKRREDAAAEAFEATLSESEEADDSEAELDSIPEAVVEKYPSAAAISVEEIQQNRQEFKALMQARFLNGEDGGAEADRDASLDDDWAKERTQDAEDKYFDEA